MTDSPPTPTPTPPSRSRPWHALWLALAAVGLAVGGLLVGYGPLGGDPDCLYRPIKGELGRALRAGTLPLWSDHFGLGAPLAAESHVAAFYPPNWPIYGLLPMATGYALAMWLHYVALVGTTYGYARALGLTPWGGALAAVAFALSGFQMSHACHEPFYSVLPHLTLSLWATERYLAGGRVAWLGGLALSLGAALCLGHFQIQAWTAGLVLLTALLRAWSGTASLRRLGAVGLAVGWGLAIAALQLGLTAELTRIVGFDRPPRYMMVYSFPPAHWAQLALPKLFMGFRDGSRSAYWGKEETSADEACLYVGTITLLFAAVGYVARRDRALAHWRWLVPLGLLLATLPRLWPDGFELLLKIPVVGHFRAPGRYTLFTTLGLCLLAGRGLDLAQPARRFWLGYGLAAAFAVGALTWGVWWSGRPNVARHLTADDARLFLLAGVGMWAVALGAAAAWRRWSRERVAVAALPVVLAAVELTYLYYHGTVPRGWPMRLSEESPIFARLKAEPTVGLIGGPLYNVPGLATPALTPAFPYLAIFPPPPNYLLRPPRQPQDVDPKQLAWLIRAGVTHGVFEGLQPFRLAEVVYVGPDAALDRLIPPDDDKVGKARVWRLERYSQAFPAAWLARSARVVPDWYTMYPLLCQSAETDIVTYEQPDAPPASPGPRASNARLVRWDGREGEVEHDGAVDLVIRRTFYPGWTALLDGRRPVPIAKADGGLQAIRIPGAGRTRVSVHYRPPRLVALAGVSLAATVAALAVVLGGLRRRPAPQSGLAVTTAVVENTPGTRRRPPRR